MDWDTHWQWLAPLTAWLGRYALLAALVGAAAGLVLWLAGSRFSRPLVTLLAVSVGALLGMHLPQWLDWSVDGMGLAVGAAMAIGLTGYLLHNTWVGAALCLMLTLWASVVAWLVAGGGTTPLAIGWPALETSDPPLVLAALWRALPGSLPTVMPCALAGAVTAGVGVSVLSPRLARVLAYSLAGLTLLVVAGVWALRMSQPQWLAALPRQFPAQMATLLGLVGLGALIQWRLTPGGKLAGGGGGGGGAKPERSEKE